MVLPSSSYYPSLPLKMFAFPTDIFSQVCERQMRDENGFKMHTQSESHVRQMLLVGEDPKKYINDYSNQFQRDFLQLLRTSHGEKKVHLNHFYQEYIGNKEHVHMNSTKWPSLTVC
jgi:DNA/RNA-binding protein KIN17